MFKFLIVALAYAGMAFGGQMNIDATSPKGSAIVKEALTIIDSIKFVKGTSADVEDSIFMTVYRNDSAKQSSNYPLSWINHIDFESVPENNESMTVNVSVGVGAGENTILLKDIKTMEFIEMDDELDSDGDGVSDVREIFIYGSDPELNEAPKVLSFNMYDTNSEQIGTLTMSGPSIDLSFIPKGPIVFEAVMSEPTQSVTVTTKDSSAIEVTKIDSKHFKFTIPGLFVADANEFVFRAVSEKGLPSRYEMSIPTQILFTNLMVLTPTDDHQAINVTFAPSQKDGRISGYAILRAVGSKTADNSALANLSLTSSEKFIDKILPSGVSVIKTIDAGSIKDYVVADGVARYTDPVGGLSPYYTYRVVAYVKENIGGKDIYSYDLTNVATKSVGNIVFEYQAVQFGTKYDTWALCRADMRLFADIFLVSSGAPKNDDADYNYWFYNAGSDDDEDKMVWETKADKKENGKEKLNVVNINTNKYSLNVDKNGVGILLANHSDCGAYKDDVRHTLTFTYESLVKTITGYSGTDWMEYVYTYGQGGVSQDASCDKCGKKPHAGWKFNFRITWNDD